MTTTTQKFSFADYLVYDDGTGTRYGLVEGELSSNKLADYRAKYSEYSVLEIPEYWIVDPLEAKVTICQLNEGRYDEAGFTDESIIQSPTFPALKLTVAQVLAA
ncbi:Uma2 family endonuclease [Trichocoleus sp. FACHB-591]|uniref:Uma2 family endonuclease n=1 Tax=Trichocoleus sp. FACHB-591 TaxID=2692872 RepID=UPI0016889951|nr:Uma2 family endonuclease [Trichocoleus sp. FACHB-591]MBD2096036.1 Uma2 family endonuclease [Trichocoleus sp. FACHB-591]